EGRGRGGGRHGGGHRRILIRLGHRDRGRGRAREGVRRGERDVVRGRARVSAGRSPGQAPGGVRRRRGELRVVPRRQPREVRGERCDRLPVRIGGRHRDREQAPRLHGRRRRGGHRRSPIHVGDRDRRRGGAGERIGRGE